MRAAEVGALVAALWAVAVSAEPEATGDLDLEGSWYVLVHYGDAATEEPDDVYWDDELWIFERRGATLRWTVFPEPLFADEAGREAGARTGGWEPSASQRAEISRGLRVVERGVLQAELSGSEAEGWRSTSRGSAVSSGLGFERSFEITGFPAAPVFDRSEGLVGAAAESLEGRTRYETREVEGGVLAGLYRRDAALRGHFRMWRAGAIRGSQR